MAPSKEVVHMIREQWRELGFFYTVDDEQRAWRLIGSRSGLQRFVEALRRYVSDPRNATVFEHEHLWPYGHFKIMTTHAAGIDAQSVHGRLEDFSTLADIAAGALSVANSGESISLREPFAPTAPYDLLLEVREEDFDPASADPLLTEDKTSG